MLRLSPCSTLLCLAFLACASEPSASDGPLPGIPTQVEILAAGRVRCDQREVPLETFLYDMRTRVRAAAGKPEKLPLVTILAAKDAGPEVERALERVVRQLHAAGVQRVQLGGS